MDRTHRRKFGQNFLDDTTARLIAADLPVQPGQSILEIGPGQGAMTAPLLEKGVPLTAVEMDSQCVEYLQKKFAGVSHFSVVHQDILEFDMDTWIAGHGKPWLTGNLPYNVSTAIIAGIMPLLFRTCGFMGMVQLEVAERLCAKPGTRAYGSLSVWVAAHAEGRILRKSDRSILHPNRMWTVRPSFSHPGMMFYRHRRNFLTLSRLLFRKNVKELRIL
jgi:16S rRNA (adenine1518-N6/adenine1519-N6)-dimethyltransferase